MTKTRNRQPLILVAAIAVAFVLAFLAGQLLSGGSSGSGGAQPTGKAPEVDIQAPAIGSTGSAQSLPDLKQPPRKDTGSTASSGQNGSNTQGNTSGQSGTQQQGNTQPRTNTPPPSNNTQQNNTNTQQDKSKTDQKPTIVEEGGGED